MLREVRVTWGWDWRMEVITHFCWGWIWISWCSCRVGLVAYQPWRGKEAASSKDSCMRYWEERLVDMRRCWQSWGSKRRRGRRRWAGSSPPTQRWSSRWKTSGSAGREWTPRPLRWHAMGCSWLRHWSGREAGVDSVGSTTKRPTSTISIAFLSDFKYYMGCKETGSYLSRCVDRI